MKNTTMPINCPACCTEQVFKICPSIDVQKNPDLKEGIFNRDIFRFICPECGEEILVAYNCTYIDRDNNFMVALVTDGDTASVETSNYTLRIVRSINEFVEKIALMEDGIDDRIVELYKIMLEDQFEEERQGVELLGIYYGGQDFENKSLVFYIITGNAENVRAILSFDTYETIAKQFDTYPEMTKHCSEINRIWAIGTLQSGFSEDS
ncbi:MAG: CpXC domain-containing protein [Clostridia bacterium]|nr:CpXC domain-containing protein [Clostridia bacterium]